MPRPVRTSDQLRAASAHLYYEMAMLHETARALSAPQPAAAACGEVVLNALLESFAVHARVLADFFGVGPPPKPDDVVAEDYVGAVAEGLRTRLVADVRFDPVRTRVNKDVAHLTYARSERGPESKRWNPAAIIAAVDDAWAEFAPHVRRETIDDATWRDLVEPFAPRAPDAPPATSPSRFQAEFLTQAMSNTISIRAYGLWGTRRDP